MKCHSQRIDVRTMVQDAAVALGPFRAHVTKRAQNVASHGEIRLGLGHRVLPQPKLESPGLRVSIETQRRIIHDPKA